MKRKSKERAVQNDEARLDFDALLEAIEAETPKKAAAIFYAHQRVKSLNAALVERNESNKALHEELRHVEQLLRDEKAHNADLRAQRDAAVEMRDAMRARLTDFEDAALALPTYMGIPLPQRVSLAAVDLQKAERERDEAEAAAARHLRELDCRRAELKMYADGLHSYARTVRDLRRRLSEQAATIRGYESGDDPSRNITRSLLRVEERYARNLLGICEQYGIERDAALAEVERLKALHCNCDEEQGQHSPDCVTQLSDAIDGMSKEIERLREAIAYPETVTICANDPGYVQGYNDALSCIARRLGESTKVDESDDPDYPSRYRNGACDDCDPSFGCFTAPALCCKRPLGPPSTCSDRPAPERCAVKGCAEPVFASSVEAERAAGDDGRCAATTCGTPTGPLTRIDEPSNPDESPPKLSRSMKRLAGDIGASIREVFAGVEYPDQDDPREED